MTYSVTPHSWVDIDDVQSATMGGIRPDLVVVADSLVTQYAADFEALANRPLVADVTDEVCRVVNGRVLTQHRPVVAMGFASSPGASYTSAVVEGFGWVADTYVTEVTVATYSASFSETQLAAARGAVVARTKRMLAKEEDDALGVTSTSDEGYTAAYIDEGWTEGEKALIESMRRRAGT